jgi:hypothetical protein
MRIRTIKPEFFTHEALFEAELEFRLPLRIAFVGLWCCADREGRFKWEPRRLGVQILPYDQCDFSRVLDALLTRGFIVKYASDLGQFGCIPSFLKHQVINNRERASDLPNSLDCIEIDASTTREPRDDHASKAEGKGRERNMEGNMEGKEPSSADADESDFFSQAEITPKKETVSSEGINFACWFRDTLPEKTNMPDKWEKSFAQTYDDLVRLDGRNDAEIKRVCQWARNDSFWSSNFQSPAKLRKRNKDGIQYYDVFLEKAHQVKRAVQKGTIENIQLKILNGPDKNV